MLINLGDEHCLRLLLLWLLRRFLHLSILKVPHKLEGLVDSKRASWEQSLCQVLVRRQAVRLTILLLVGHGLHEVGGDDPVDPLSKPLKHTW